MRQTTLVLVFNQKGEILLNMKKRGFGEGKYNGAGGKLESGETIIEGAKRELYEETGIDLSAERFEKKGFFHFTFENRTDWNQEVTLFVIKDYTGEAFETEEMKPTWFNTEEIPYDKMWEDDSYWLPRVIKGEDVEYEFNFNDDGNILNYKQII
ncbi:MAG: 8-oxo-dGTP diphosphatase [Candidatus Gracilibacteria bacterium]|nr:8-oxo-dGTP diphosphatase [Candidatus Gracilibacteria bacterium]